MSLKSKFNEKRISLFKKSYVGKMNYFMIIIFLMFGLSSVLEAQETDQIKQGIELFQKKEYEKAKIIFREILKNHPDNILANFNLGKIYYKESDFENAVTFFDKAVKLNNADANYYVWLGKAYEGKLEDAGLFSYASITSKMKSSFIKAIEIDPDNIEARFELAKFYNNGSPLVGGSDSKAREQLMEIQKRDSLKGYELSAYFYWYEGEWEAAIKDYQKYLNRDATNAEVYYDLGICFLKIKDNNNAFKSFITCVNINPDNHKAHYYLGKIYQSKGQNDLARNEYETAIRINKSEKKYQEALYELN